MKRMLLRNTKDTFTLVDDDVFYKKRRFRWRLHSAGYVTRSVGPHGFSYLHREILNPKKGEYVDHKNWNKLDNRGENLRIVTQSQNSMWSRRKPGATGFLGVSSHKHAPNSFRAYAKINDKQVNIGSFRTPLEAAIARDKFVKKNIWRICHP